MSGDSKFFLGVVIAAVVVVAVVVGFSKTKPQPSFDSLDLSTAQKLGDDSLPVKIVEFGDFQCPSCQAAAVPLRQAIEKNKDKVQLSFFHFPLSQHKNAISAAVAAEAAGKQGKFWEMYDLLYQNQTQWEGLSEPQDTFTSYAKELEIDTDRFQQDVTADELRQNVLKNVDYGLSLGVNETPTFVVNGKVTSAKSAEDWQTIISEALTTE